MNTMNTFTAELFLKGSQQAVILPNEFRFDGDRVYIRRQGQEVILSPTSRWDDFFHTKSVFGDDFLSYREDGPPQERESI